MSEGTPAPGAKPLRDQTEPELREQMRAVGGAVELLLPPGTLFVVLAFDAPGVAQYISNAHRADIIRVMRECACRLEAREDITR